MSITEIGIEGEQKARVFLKAAGFNLFQADWIGYKNGRWVLFEVKHKERFNPPPFEGHGLDIRQVKARLNFQKDTGIRCLFLVFDLGTKEVFYQWLDKLEANKYFNTKNGIRVYPISSFLNFKL